MQTRKRKIILSVLLMISVGNYLIIGGIENVRTIQFLSIFAIGALFSLLIRELSSSFKK